MQGPAEPRYFESVAKGDLLTSLTKGPLSTTHLMRWSAAIEAWHKVHYDQAFAVEHDKLPGLLVNGSLKQQFVQEFLSRWAGPEGWVWKVDLAFRAMNLAGETLHVWGEVKACRRTASFGLVHVELGVRNDAGKESVPGIAVIALPYRDGPAVPYPFIPPVEEGEE